MAQWSIAKWSLACAACERAFDEEEEFVSALYDRAPEADEADDDEETAGDFSRRDYCLACVEKALAENSCFSHWRTRMPKKNGPARRFVDNEVILDLFHRLAEEKDLSKRNFRYVLALLLMRKKLFKFKEIRRGDGGEALVAHSKLDDQDYVVYYPQLTEEELETLTQDVGRVLNLKL